MRAGGTGVTDHEWDGGVESRWGSKAYELYGRVPRRSVRSQIRSRLLKMEDTAAGHAELARWCEQVGLDEAIAHKTDEIMEV